MPDSLASVRAMASSRLYKRFSAKLRGESGNQVGISGSFPGATTRS
jgi:hypothetical protein